MMDFFAAHTYPYWALFGWAFFPRITFWLFSAMTGGLGFWIGVLFTPHIMVAYWATHYYWDTNPILCLLAWLNAFGGSRLEVMAAKKKNVLI